MKTGAKLQFIPSHLNRCKSSGNKLYASATCRLSSCPARLVDEKSNSMQLVAGQARCTLHEQTPTSKTFFSLDIFPLPGTSLKYCNQLVLSVLNIDDDGVVSCSPVSKPVSRGWRLRRLSQKFEGNEDLVQ